jgi:hypothetical protein
LVRSLTLANPLSARDTDATDTWARRATSRMVASGIKSYLRLLPKKSRFEQLQLPWPWDM